MIVDPNGMPIVQPLVDSAELDELLNPAFALIGTAMLAQNAKPKPFGHRTFTTNYVVPGDGVNRVTNLNTVSLIQGGMTQSSNTLIVPEDALYLVYVRVSFLNAPTGNRSASICINGVFSDTIVVPAVPTNSSTIQTFNIFNLVATDRVQAGNWQSSGANVNINGGELIVLKVSDV